MEKGGCLPKTAPREGVPRRQGGFACSFQAPRKNCFVFPGKHVNLMDERAGPLHSENPKCDQNCFISSGTHRLFTPLPPFSGSEHPSIQHPRASSISVEFPFALGGQGRPSLSTQLLPWRAPTAQHPGALLSALPGNDSFSPPRYVSPHIILPAQPWL